MDAEHQQPAEVIHIESEPGVCGGKPRVAGTRTRVWDIHVWHELQALSPAEIVADFPTLSVADVYAALAYYHDHRQGPCRQGPCPRSLPGAIRQKTDAWEGGHRVPLMARWPGRIPAGGERETLFTQVDIMATLAEAAGVEPPPGASPDGMSDLAAFTDPERAPAKRTEALFQGTGSYALRQGDWLFIPRQGSGGMTVQVPPRAPWGLPYAKMNQRNSDIDPQGRVQPGSPSAQLYNLRDDLSQTTNRFRDQPATAKRLSARMEELLPKPSQVPAPKPERGRDAVTERDVRSIAGEADWGRQRERWRAKLSVME